MTASAKIPTTQQRLAARDPGNRRPVMYQSWRDLLFLHWRFDADAIQDTLPPGLTVDLYDGDAYVGIVPFFMCDVRPRFLPCAPYLSNFLELNVRTYVYDASGVPGVWFYSLDANRLPAIWAGRTFFNLNYRRAKMAAARDSQGWVNYSSRCDAGNYESNFEYRGTGASEEAEPGTLEFFLLERYFLYAFSERQQKMRRGQVAHAPYQFRSANLREFDAGPMTNQGLVPIDFGGEGRWNHACVAEDVDVHILGLETVAID